MEKRVSESVNKVGERGAFSGYFSNIRRAITSTFEGLSVTSSWMFRRPITIQYPDKIDEPIQDTLPDTFRGILEVDLARCGGCMLCAKTCPINVLDIVVEKNAETGVREIIKFDIDIGRCMYCGLCSESCNFDAIRHTTDFEAVVSSPDRLVLRYVSKPVPVAKAKGNVTPRRPQGSILRDVASPGIGGHRWQGKTAEETETPNVESDAISVKTDDAPPAGEAKS